MRRVERTIDAPEDLIEKGAIELEAAILHYGAVQPPDKSFPFKRYKLASVKAALEKMFHGKCAYCETFYASTQPLDVEHYRPKGAVANADGHRGYWWIAMEWQNLLPSCIDCNRKRNQITPRGDTSLVQLLDMTAGFSVASTVLSGKKDSFPLAAGGVRAENEADSLLSERALLLNPCEDRPENHLVYFFDRDNLVSFVLARELADDPNFTGDNALSLKGATSIHVYGLNRLRLVQARTRLLRHLEFLADLVIDLKLMADELKGNADLNVKNAGGRIDGYGDRVLAELIAMGADDKPYCGMVTAWLETFRVRLEDAL